MMRIILVISILLLSSCGYHKCIKPQDMLYDEYSNVVAAGIKDGEKEHITWVKSDLILAGRESLDISVSTVNVNFCSNDKRTIDIFVNGNEKSGDKKKFYLGFNNIMPKDKLSFRVVPEFEFTVDKDICDNKDPRVYVQNKDKCMDTYFGERHYIPFGKHNGQMNNMMYLEYTDGVLKKKEERKEEEENWINFPSRILYNIDYDMYDKLLYNINNNTNKNNISKEEVVNSEMSLLCNRYNEIESEDKDKRNTMMEKYKRLYDAYTVNMLCGNLCGFRDYKNGENKKNCFVIEKANYIPTQQDVSSCTDGTQCNVIKNNVQYTELRFVYLSYDSEDINNFLESDGVIKKWKDDENKPNVNNDSTLNNAVGLLTGYNYKFSKEIKNGGQDKGLYLEVRSPKNATLTGKYTIEAMRDCSGYAEDSLYYTISKGVPNSKPGDSGTHKIDFASDKNITVSLTKENTAGELYFGVKDNGDGYKNNTGYFNITVVAKKRIPKIISYMVNTLKDSLYRGLYGTSATNSGSVHLIYDSLIKNTHFIQIVKALLVLYILINALFYFVGFAKSSIFELLVITLKIGIVMYVIGPNSWDFFHNHLFKLFTDAPIELINILTGQESKNSTSFAFLDMMLYRFSLSSSWLQMLSLFFTGPIGWVSVTLIFWGLCVLFLTIAGAIITYLISIVLIGLLLSIAPFFIICILFKRTKAIFDAWIKSLVQTVMQPVIIFASFALLTETIDSIIQAMFNFESCDACVINPTINIGIIKITFCLLEFLLPSGFSPLSTFSDNMRDSVNGDSLIFIGLPAPITKIIAFVIMVNATKHFVGSSGEMCTSIFGSFANLSSVADNAKESLLGIVGMDRNTRMQRQRYNEMNSLNNQNSDGERKRSSFAAPLPAEDGNRSSRSGVSIPESPPSSFGK
ncbi:type IV secretion system protein [Ehrlichia ruminantium]|uniref:type IV secretion system protein n=1 Tax=Ehrlichia ruminantium TaxID=779 RepID=UPI0015DC61B5|nr:type IV secretion system protein [Ehrlichia ruminantium]QLK53361.1 type IV secretion system protein [Ehrlichia ruminantium]